MDGQGQYAVILLLSENVDGTENEQDMQILACTVLQYQDMDILFVIHKALFVRVNLLNRTPDEVTRPFLEECHAKCRSHLFFAVSRPKDSINALHSAIREAYDALTGQAMTCTEESLHFCTYDPSRRQGTITVLNAKTESDLRSFLENGQAKGCIEILQAIFQANRQSSVLRQRALCSYMVALLMHFDKGVSFDDYCRFFAEIKDMFSFPAMWLQVKQRYLNSVMSGVLKSDMQKQISDFIEAHYTDPMFSLQNVVEYTGLSYSYVSRYFKQYTGRGFVGYVTQLRIDRAKLLLRDTDLPIREIHESVGFTVFSSFSRAFRQQTGQSPSEYRNACRHKTACGIHLPQDRIFL